jgi:hypothetical protein
MKFKIGLYGAAVNVVVVAGLLFFSAVTRGNGELSLYLYALPMLAASAFVVYYFVVSSYVVKRAGIQNPVFIDSLAGMLAELIVVTLGAVCYSMWRTFSNMQGQDFRAIFSDLMTGILVNLLWLFGMFMVHILIVGNIAGLAGWYVLKKIDPKKLS